MRGPTYYTVRRTGVDAPIGETSTLNEARRMAFFQGGDTITHEATGEVTTVPRALWLPSAHDAIVKALSEPSRAPAEPAPAMYAACGAPTGGELVVLGTGRSHERAEEDAGACFPGVPVLVVALIDETVAEFIAAGERDCTALGMDHALLARPEQPLPDPDR